MALQYFVLFNDVFSRLLSNLFVLAGVATFFSGSLARYGRTPPRRRIAIATGIGFSFFLWFLYVDHDITRRIYVINFTVGAVMILMAIEIAKTRNRKLIDNLLLGQLIFWSVAVILRPVVVVWIDGPYNDYETLRSSLNWITLTFFSSLMLLVFPLIQITAIAIDVMDELKRESQTDSLSGLLNRRGFEDRMNEIAEDRSVSGLPVSLVVCDLDRFKSVNDTFGHAVGDRLIALFADTLRECAADHHILARSGGEEFAILMPGSNLAAARLFAEGVRARYSAVSVSGLPDDRHGTASFGVAQWTQYESADGLFIRADTALYAAKNAGRDCVRVAEERAQQHSRTPSAAAI